MSMPGACGIAGEFQRLDDAVALYTSAGRSFADGEFRAFGQFLDAQTDDSFRDGLRLLHECGKLKREITA